MLVRSGLAPFKPLWSRLVDAHDVAVSAQQREQTKKRPRHKAEVDERRVLRERADHNLACTLS